MAIAFTLPSDEDTDARYEMLNRLLLELCELLRTIMTARGSDTATPRVRPLSDSALPRMPDLLLHGSDDIPRRRICSFQTPPASPSCSHQHSSRTFSEVFDGDNTDLGQTAYFGDDEVFCGSTTVPIGSRPSLPIRQRRRRKRSTSLRETKKKSVKAKVDDNRLNADEALSSKKQPVQDDEKVASEISAPIVFQDEKEEEGSSSLISTFLSTRLGGPLWTAVVIVLGWKILSTTKR